MTGQPLDYQPLHAAPAEPSPVEQMQAEVDSELERQDPRDAMMARMRAEMARMRAALDAMNGGGAEANTDAAASVDAEEAREQELLAEGCVKVPLTIDDPAEKGALLQTFVWVRPHNEWRQDALAAVGMGNFPAWAQECLATSDDIDEWMDANPSLTQIRGFFLDWRRLTGQDEGKSSASPRRSRRTRLK